MPTLPASDPDASRGLPAQAIPARALGPASVKPVFWSMLQDRRFRIVLLLLTLIVLSGLDLALTLTYMLNIGMFEANPLARTLVASGGPWPLALWKIGTTSLAAWILFTHRKYWQAEVGAWICTSILVMLTFHWMHYITHVGNYAPVLAHEAQMESERSLPITPATQGSGWVTLVTDD